jgi:topoisomerase-4 subunit B
MRFRAPLQSLKQLPKPFVSFNKSLKLQMCENRLWSAISIKVMEPVFESQTKTKLGSDIGIGTGMPSVRTLNFVKTKLDILHKKIRHRCFTAILQTERERKELSGIRKLILKTELKINLHNKKIKRLSCTSYWYKTEGQYAFITEEILHRVRLRNRDVNSQPF